MRTAKEFLGEECESVRLVLEETLRHKYGGDGSQQFFEECGLRLQFIKSELGSAADDNDPAVARAAMLLCQLSDLVSRIERSSVSEYSWPFVEQLKRIATATCTEATLTNPKTPPQIYVLCAGGIDGYMIIPEMNRPSGSRTRIHTIVLPRTMKHMVLLHPILGHELGHAMWRCSEHRASLAALMETHLFANSPFRSPTDTAAWLYSRTAPPALRANLANIAKSGIHQTNFFISGANWDRWKEEILCDFIGLTTFGPSFVAAESHLLTSMDPSGVSLGADHPPVGCRINTFRTGAAALGLDTAEKASAADQLEIQAFWQAIDLKRKPDEWFNVFTQQQVESTVGALRAMFQTMDFAAYPIPSANDLAPLLANMRSLTPPVGCSIEVDGAVKKKTVDFRHVLYAGWIASATEKRVNFTQINRLCEHGLLQQRAIDYCATAA